MKKLLFSILAFSIIFSLKAQPIFTPTTHAILVQSNNFFLVTAAHVIFQIISNRISDTLISTNAVIKNETQPDGNFVLNLDLDSLKKIGLIKRHPYHDITVLKVGFGRLDQASIFFSTSTPNFGTNHFVYIPVEQNCRLFDDVPVGNETYILGFPTSLFNGPQTEIDFSHPLIRKGVISQKNTITRKLIIDSAVYPGNSGGPVLVVERPQPNIIVFKVIGIVTQYVPVQTQIDVGNLTTNQISVQVNSGYGVVEPIDFAIELMNQFPPN